MVIIQKGEVKSHCQLDGSSETLSWQDVCRELEVLEEAAKPNFVSRRSHQSDKSRRPNSLCLLHKLLVEAT